MKKNLQFVEVLKHMKTMTTKTTITYIATNRIDLKSLDQVSQ